MGCLWVPNHAKSVPDVNGVIEWIRDSGLMEKFLNDVTSVKGRLRTGPPEEDKLRPLGVAFLHVPLMVLGAGYVFAVIAFAYEKGNEVYAWLKERRR